MLLVGAGERTDRAQGCSAFRFLSGARDKTPHEWDTMRSAGRDAQGGQGNENALFALGTSTIPQLQRLAHLLRIDRLRVAEGHLAMSVPNSGLCCRQGRAKTLNPYRDLTSRERLL